MTPLEIAALLGTSLGSVLATLAVVRLRGKAPPDGSRLRPPVLTPEQQVRAALARKLPPSRESDR